TTANFQIRLHIPHTAHLPRDCDRVVNVRLRRNISLERHDAVRCRRVDPELPEARVIDERDLDLRGDREVVVRVVGRGRAACNQQAGDEQTQVAPAFRREAHTPTAWKPASTMRISAVTARPASLRRNNAASATSEVSTVRRSGARSRYPWRMFVNPGIPAAASVLMGPAEIALTRMFFGPRSAAR